MTSNKGDYTLLAALSGIYLLSIFRFQNTPKYLLLSTLIFGLIYIMWGIFHHVRSHNFHGRIVLEYFLVAFLGVAIVSTLLI